MADMAVGSPVVENLFISSTAERAEASEREKSSMESKVSHDEFLTLLTAQLTNQDPLKPMDDTQFIGQMAQLQALDEQVSMTKALIGLRADNQLRSGTEMIGLNIIGSTKTGLPASGGVSSVSMSDSNVILELANGQRVPFEAVTEVLMPAPMEE